MVFSMSEFSFPSPAQPYGVLPPLSVGTTPTRALQSGTTLGQRAEKAATEVEALFLRTVLDHMTAGFDSDENYFGGGHAENLWRSLFHDELSKLVAGQTNLGLKESITSQLLAVQQTTLP